MRIVAGEWRGRRIDAPEGRDVRPTSDRAREAWMSIVHADLAGANVLDLFAGTGALGLEALSRGAKSVEFVELAAATITVLEKNIATLGAGDRAAVHRGDALRFAERASRGSAYDVVFADPPYRKGFAEAVTRTWLDAPFATIFSIEHEATLTLPAGGDTRRYGDTAITIYRK